MHRVEESVEPDTAARESTPATASPSKSWLRFVVPSVGDLVFILLLIALTCGTLAKGLLGDAGIGWHIRTGELILSAHAVPRVDPFSSVMRGKPWFAWEWLYDYVVGALHAWFGLNGVVLLTGVVIALTFAIVFRRMMARGAQLPVAVIVLLLALPASTIHFLARPHVVSWLLAVLWFAALERFEAEGKWRRLVWLPLSMLIWVNVHGGFLVGLALLGIYCVGSLLTAFTARDLTERASAFMRARVITILGIACTLFTFANPYGYQLHVHIYRYLTDRFLMDHIDEFLSPNFHGFPQRCFAMLVLVTIAGIVGARRSVTTNQLMVVLFAIYIGLLASRNIPISALLLAMIAAPQISSALREMAKSPQIWEGMRRVTARFDLFSTRMAAFDAGMKGRLWPGLAVVVLVWACWHQGWIGSTRAMDAHFDDRRFPVRAVEYLADSAAVSADDAVFCPDRWGGYLIYRLFPKRLVAVDDRHDLYGTEYFKRYLKIVHGEPGWREGLAETGSGWALVPADTVLAGLLASDGGWRAAYRDDVAVLYRRDRERGN